MAGKKKKGNIEEPPKGAPEWMVTFSDCMTLLLTFFVLMLSYATFDPSSFRDLSDALGRKEQTVKMSQTIKLDTITSSQSKDVTIPTLDEDEDPENSQSKTKNLDDSKHPLDFKNLKVFTTSSKDFFWGKGTNFTPQGQEILDALCIFLKHIPSRVVISEFPEEGSDDLGIERANEIAKYLIYRGIGKNEVNISSMCIGDNIEGPRTVEITLLEESVYQ